MDGDLLKSIIDRLDRNAFEAFFLKLLNQSKNYDGKVEKLIDLDDRILESPPERFYQCADAFFMCYFPHTIYKNFTLDKLDLTILKNLIATYISKRTYSLWLPVDGTALYGINNFDSEKLGISDEELLSYYKKELGPILQSDSYQIGMGNINTFLNASAENKNELQEILYKFFRENDEGICISLSDEGVHASRFLTENEFAGVTKSTSSIIQPTLKKLEPHNNILDEFNKLIFSNVKESMLEEFLREYYQVIFGGQYDRISTQIWLRFPDLDIGKRNRRLDIFMRNAVHDDWELYELKRSNVKLTRTASDVPMLVSSVNNAIAQAKNYKRLLEQDEVKRALAADGIEYYVPEINLVIGKKPSISTAQWRQLLEDNQHGLKITTYDTLLEEAKSRLADIEKILR